MNQIVEPSSVMTSVCGPPPPDGTKTAGGKPRRQTLEPYPGVEVEEGGCAAKGRAGLIAAASASRVDPEGNHGGANGWRWVREERDVIAELEDGSIVVKWAFAGEGYFARAILKEAGDAVVLGPPDLREAVLGAAERLLVK